MRKLFIKIPILVLLLLILTFFESCKEHETVTPTPATSQAESEVLQEIKALGFAAETIKDHGDYYLAEGNLYFAKKYITPKEKPKRQATERYAVFKIRMDESVSKNENWVQGVEKMIADWNARKEVHFHFALDNNGDADIRVIEDPSLPQDVAIATDYPRNGRIGSAIRINPNYNAPGNARENATQALAQSLKHCVGFRHTDSVKDHAGKLTDQSLGARTEGVALSQSFLFAIQGDLLWSRTGHNNEINCLGGGWMGSSAMTGVTYSHLVVGSDRPSKLYVIQFGALYEADPITPELWRPLGTGWEGATCMTGTRGLRAQGFELLIMHGDILWAVDADNGRWLQQNITAPGAFAMTELGQTSLEGIVYAKLMILQKKKILLENLLTASQYDPYNKFKPHTYTNSSGVVYTSQKISMFFSPNVFTGFSNDSYNGYILANNYYYYPYFFFYNTLQEPRFEAWGITIPMLKNIEATATFDGRYRLNSNSCYVIADGTLWVVGGLPFLRYKIQLDIAGEWAGTKLITTIERL